MLEGKGAVITGSTSGIGLGIAKALARQGADVMLNGFGAPHEIEAVLKDVAAEGPGRVIHSPADMSRPDEIREMIAEARRSFGNVDILVNNAGIQHVAPVEEFPIDLWDRIIAINLSAAFHATAAALPLMKQRKWGRIINTASAHALIASPYKSAYVAAKHGIAGLTKTVALETATDGITVNAIAPGYVWTPLVERQIPDTAKARGMTEAEVKEKVLLAGQPTREFVRIEEVAALALFLCTDEARSITGAVLPVDGGWTAA